jgi:predicted amidohydrolase
MKVDIKIKGGRVIDIAAGIDEVRDLYIQGNRVIAGPEVEAIKPATTIDAGGCLVVPGLIDFHAHYFADGTEWGTPADSSFLPVGVTTAVDAGSAGSATYECFAKMNTCMYRMRTFSFLNVSPGGLVSARYEENIDPCVFDAVRITQMFEKYQGQLIGLKVRQSKEIAGGLGLRPLEATLQLAERLGCPVVVHTTNPAGKAEDIADMLRPGDVYCHPYNHRGDTIMGGDGKVKPAIRAARQRGVLFDSANARVHFYFPLAATAISQNFLPDIISTDITSVSSYGEYVYGLPYVMMHFLALGMPLTKVIEACTATPARALGQEGRIGTLKPGAFADVAVFRLRQKDALIKDYFGNPLQIHEWLVPQMTILDGKIAYRQIDFDRFD